MTKEERKQAVDALSDPERTKFDVHMCGVRVRSDADGYYMMLAEVEPNDPFPPKLGRRFTVNITPEHYEEMLDEWVHGPRDER